MKCPKCNGSGKSTIAVAENPFTGAGGFFPKCKKCNGTGEVELINEEWLRSLSTEEKAEAFYEIAKNDFEKLRKRFYGIANDDIDAIAMWLKEKHNG